MKKIRILIISVIVVALVGFTAAYLLTAYNSGKIGDKAEKIEDEFESELLGTWSGKYQISKLTFNDDNSVYLTVLGVSLKGTYEDNYDIKSEKHTLDLSYSTQLGVSVRRSFDAEIIEDTLNLNDLEISSVNMKFTRGESAELDTTTQSNALKESLTSTSVTENNTISVYNEETEEVYNRLLGKWSVINNQKSGYEFFENSIAKVTLLGVSYNGTYSLSVDEATGKCIVQVLYASIGNVEIRNRFYVDFPDEDSLTLTLVATNTPIEYRRAD